jgi:hypothetical protein
MGAPDSSVRQPCHPTVRVLTVSIVGALSSCGTGQFGAAPNMHCSLSGAPSAAALTSTRTVRALYRCRRPLPWLAVAPLVHRTVRWCTGQSGGTPDSPVNYSGAALLKPEGEEFEVIRPWCTVQSGAPDQGSLRFLFAPFFLNPNLIFLLVCVEPLTPVEYII